MKRRGIISSNQDILRISEPGSAPIKFNGETVGTASNIKIDRTGALVGADLDLDPEIKELIDKMQQAPKVQGMGLKWSWGSEMRHDFNDLRALPVTFEGCILGTCSDESKPDPVTLESLAGTIEEPEKSRPTMKKSELFAHPEQAPEWLADEFEVAEFIESDNIEQDKLIIMRADLPETLALLTPNLRGLGKCKRVNIIAPKGWFV